MQYLLAHDLGTTGNKANLFDETGRLVAGQFEAYPVAYPQPQWAEQDPHAWWRAICASTRALRAQYPDAFANIAAVSFSGQMMGVVAVDRQRRALRPALIWADQRAEAEAQFLMAQCGMENVYARTGHRISPAYTAAKMLWLKNQQPEIYAQAEKFLCAKDYVVLQLTDSAHTDFSDASGSNLFDLSTRAWCDDFIGAIGLDAAKLPRLVSSITVVGEVTRRAAQETGLRAGTPVVMGGGDGACAAVGAGVVEPGECYCNIGSSAWISFSSATVVRDPQMRTFTFHHLHPARYTPMGTMQAAGGARDWFLNITGDVNEHEIAQVPAGAHDLIFLPYLIGERSPWWNPHARGAFVGLTMAHTRAAMARAVMEGVTFNLRLILDALESQGAQIPSVRFIGGGARSPLWQQMLADIFNKPIALLELNAEATSWGAAVAGGIGVGVYRDWSVANAQARVTRVIEPHSENVARYAERVARFTETYRALNQ
ncbi:MAG: xylulokinase [Chloroflexi bacterium]|nr:xylulokinase [Chloroflexota bacterium]